MSYVTLLFISTALLLATLWLKNKYSYWRNRGVNGPDPWPIVGNAGSIMLITESVHDFAKRLYDEFPDEKIVGYYQGLTPALLIRDPELIKEVTVKEFEKFHGRGLRQREDRFEDNLFLAEGDTWKTLRHKLSPQLSSSKVKTMMPLVDACIQRFLQHMERLVREQGPEHDIRELARLVMLDVNGTCSFGIALDVYSGQKNIFIEVAEGIFNLTTTLSVRRFLEILYPGFERFLDQVFGIKGPVHYLSSFFAKLINDMVEERKEKPKQTCDLMNMLIGLKEQEDSKANAVIDDDFIAAQAMSFYAAGFEPTSLFLTFTLFELALQEKIQQRVYEEVSQVLEKHDGRLTYESLKEMKYTYMVAEEIFRKYSVSLNRKCFETHTLSDGSHTIEKGIPIIIPVNGLHHDPKFYKDPHVFDPERFSPENRANIPALAYYPFGAGPRQCVGPRFGKAQCLMATAYFLNKFHVYATPRTPKSSLELKTDPRFITLRTVQGMWLGVELRQK